jgi:hypothetical protein
LPDDLRDYLKEKSKSKRTTMSSYIIDLIESDKSKVVKSESAYIVKEVSSIESDIMKTIVCSVIEKNMFKTITRKNLDELELELSETIDKLVNLDYKLSFEAVNFGDGGVSGAVYFKRKGAEDFRCLNITIASSGTIIDGGDFT